MKFPEDVAGWLSRAEGEKLYELAASARVLELGSYCGRSTICLAQASREVHVCDCFTAMGTGGDSENRNTYEDFWHNIVRYGVAGNIVVHRGFIPDEVPLLSGAFDLIFVDASHDAASVHRDILLVLPFARPGTVMAFHDYANQSWPDVQAVVDRWRQEWEIEVVDSLGIICLP